MSLQIVGLGLVGAIIAYFLFKMFLGVLARAVAVPLAIGVGVSIGLMQVHPGLAVASAVLVYVVVGKMVKFSARLAISLTVLLAAAYFGHQYLLRAGFLS